MACSALFLGLLLLQSLAAPAFRGPDEPHHFDLVREWSHEAEYDYVYRQVSEQVIAALRIVEFSSRSRNLEQAEAPARADRPRFDELGDDDPSPAYNQISKHPPLYPILYGSLVRAVDVVEPGPRWAFDRELGLVRLLSILSLAPLPALVLVGSRRLGASQPAAVTGALVPSISPQFTHIGALVNNDNLLTVLAAVALVLLARLLAADSRRWWEDGAVGLVAGLMLLTKASALGVCVAVTLAYLVHWRQRQVPWRTRVGQTSVVALTTIACGGWWYVWSLLGFGGVHPRREGHAPQLTRAGPEFEAEFGTWFDTFRSWLPLRFFGDFGWFDVRIGSGWVGVSLVVVAIGVAVAMLSPPLGPVRRSHLGVLLAPGVVMLVLIAVNSWNGYVKTAQFPAIQGRYLFVGVPFLSVVLGIGWTRIAGRREAAVPLVVAVGALAFQFAGLSTMLDFYWGPPGGSLRDQVAAMITWSPWPRALTLLFVSIPLGAALVLLVVLGAMALRSGDDRRLSEATPVPAEP